MEQVLRLSTDMDDRRLARGRRGFEYHCYEGEDSSDAKLWHHTHQQVAVLKKLKPPDVDPELSMYHIKFADGFEYDVFSDELLLSPAEYTRPAYRKGGDTE